MYAIKRKGFIQEELIIQNEKGETELEISVELHVDDMLPEYNRVRSALAQAQLELEKDGASDATLAAYGTVVVSLFQLIFGAQNTEKLLSYYENRYSELLEDVAPFISNVIQPKILQAMKARSNRYKELAKK